MKENIDLSRVKISENSLFTKVLEVEPILIKFLEVVLHIKVSKINQIVREYVVDDVDGSKDVRFDVYAEDSTTIYDIEIQTSNTYDLPKRTRYYQSKIDRKNLFKGEKSYNKLRKSFIVFICLFHPFHSSGTNQAIYQFENMCVTENNKMIKLNDEAYKIFVNCKCDLKNVTDNHLKSLIELLKDGYLSQTKSDLTDMMIMESNKARQNDNWRDEYMTLLQEVREVAREEGRQEGRAEGIKEGKAEGKKEVKRDITIEMLKSGLDTETILKCSKLTLEELEEIKKEL